MKKEEIKALVLQAKEGNREAFGRLYEEVGRSVYFNCLKLIGSAQEAQDAVQDTFMTALLKLGELREPENFSAWVNRIAINKCRAYFRKPAAEELTDEALEVIPDEGLIPEEYAADVQKRRVIMQIIDRELTAEQRRSVILYYFDSLSVEEIAQIMECPSGTVTSRLSAARKKIKEAVLIYEKKTDDRLHAVLPVPVLTRLLLAESQDMPLPPLSVFGGDTPSADTSQNTQNSQNSHTNTVPEKTSAKAVSGGKTMLSTVKAKVIAGVCAAVIVGGGIAVAVNMGGKPEKADEKPAASRKAESEDIGAGDIGDLDDLDNIDEKDVENALDSLAAEEDESSDETSAEPQAMPTEPSSEITSAAMSSGLVQIGNDIFQLGGKITVAELYEQYSDKYDFAYGDGTYEENKDNLLEYDVGGDNIMLTNKPWYTMYRLTLTPKGSSKNRIAVYPVNLTDPNGKVTLENSYVAWAEELDDEYDVGCNTPAWLPHGLLTRLNQLIYKHDVDDCVSAEEITAANIASFFEQNGMSSDSEISISGSYLSYVYTKPSAENAGRYGVSSDGSAYCGSMLGNATPMGLTPLYSLRITIDPNTDKMYSAYLELVDFI
jgi:RNA polymerase sigma factor (sigma-70 family)